MVRFSKGRALVFEQKLWSQPFENWTILNPDIFVRISYGFWQNVFHLSGFQMVGLLDFRIHLKSIPFTNLPLFDHLKSKLVRFSDPHCTRYLYFSAITTSNIQIPTVFILFCSVWNVVAHSDCCNHL